MLSSSAEKHHCTTWHETRVAVTSSDRPAEHFLTLRTIFEYFRTIFEYFRTRSRTLPNEGPNKVRTRSEQLLTKSKQVLTQNPNTSNRWGKGANQFLHTAKRPISNRVTKPISPLIGWWWFLVIPVFATNRTSAKRRFKVNDIKLKIRDTSVNVSVQTSIHDLDT